MEHLRSLADASRGKRSGAKNGLNKPNSLPLVASGCDPVRMVMVVSAGRSRRLRRVQPRAKPRLRGRSHEVAFYLALPLGAALVLEAPTGRGRAAAVVFATSVAVMFGASALYHRVDWPDARRLWMRR